MIRPTSTVKELKMAVAVPRVLPFSEEINTCGLSVNIAEADWEGSFLMRQVWQCLALMRQNKLPTNSFKKRTYSLLLHFL